MTREEALFKLEQSPYDPQLIQQDFVYVAAKLGISTDDLHGYHEILRKFYWDYRNRLRVFELGEWILSRITGTRRGGAY